MKQPTKHKKQSPKPIEPTPVIDNSTRNAASDCVVRVPKYGTSKLEKMFAAQFLDRMGLKYIYQYHAADIGRFFDFAVTIHTDVEYPMEVKDGITCVKQGGKLFQITFMIEVDGDYYHFNPETNEGRQMNRMQRRNRRVDDAKDQWCAMRCIPLMRIWEHDIKKNPKDVLKRLEIYAGPAKIRLLVEDSVKK